MNIKLGNNKIMHNMNFLINQSRVVSGTEQGTVPSLFYGCQKTLVWCPGQNKRITPLSFLHGYRKRRLKH
jgi:hypothetical protein